MKHGNKLIKSAYAFTKGLGGEVIIGCCGLNCAECPVFIATAKNNSKLKRTTANEWSTRYEDFLEKPLEPKDINCTGCYSKATTFMGCQNCLIRKCCGGKRYRTCAQCANFENCEMLNGFFDFGHQEAKQNLEKIRGYY